MREVELTFEFDPKAANMAMAPPLVGLDWVMTRTERGSGSAAGTTVGATLADIAMTIGQNQRKTHPFAALGELSNLNCNS